QPHGAAGAALETEKTPQSSRNQDADRETMPPAREASLWVEGGPAALRVGVEYRVGVGIGVPRANRVGGGPLPELDWGERQELPLIIALSGSGARITPTSQPARLPRKGDMAPVFFAVTPIRVGDLD